MKFIHLLTTALFTGLFTTTTLGAPSSPLATTLVHVAPRNWGGPSFTMDALVDEHIGKPIVIKWGGATGKVEIKLMSGTAEDLKTVGTITTVWVGNEATWVPEAEGMYAFEILDESGGVNYSPLFWVGV